MKVKTMTELTDFGCRTTFDKTMTVKAGESISYPLTVQLDEDGHIIGAVSGDAEIKEAIAMSTKSPDLTPRPPEFKQLVTDNKVPPTPKKGGKGK